MLDHRPHSKISSNRSCPKHLAVQEQQHERRTVYSKVMNPLYHCNYSLYPHYHIQSVHLHYAKLEFEQHEQQVGSQLSLTEKYCRTNRNVQKCWNFQQINQWHELLIYPLSQQPQRPLLLCLNKAHSIYCTLKPRRSAIKCPKTISAQNNFKSFSLNNCTSWRWASFWPVVRIKIGHVTPTSLSWHLAEP